MGRPPRTLVISAGYSRSYFLRRIGPKSRQIHFFHPRNTTRILLTHSKMYPAMLLYRKFPTFTGLELAGSVRVHPRHPNWQGK
jgi:hypothetical protein